MKMNKSDYIKLKHTNISH